MKFIEELPRILVVDDKEHNRMLVTEYLESLDVIIDEAASGETCLNLLEQNSYSLIILDVQMPGMDGYQVLEKMQSNEATAEIPVVLISAIFDSEEYIIKGIERGAIDYITKPVNITILSRKVSNFLKLYEKQKKLDALVHKLEIINDRLKENEKKFKKITNSATESIVVLNSQYQIRFWNKASKKYFGYSKYEMVYEDFFEKLIAPGSHAPLKEYFGSLFENEPSLIINTIRLSGKNKSGTEFPIELSLAYFQTASNEINYTVIIRDITRRIKMESEALKAKELYESNKLMKEFMDSVSHELRTPMNAILGISNMLLKYNSENLEKKQIEGLEIINQSGSRLLDMINDVLDLSRIDAKKEAVSNEKFNLDKFLASLHSIVLSLIDEKDIKFYIRKSSNVSEFIKSDAKKLNQILTNILGNAVKFTHKGSIHLFIHTIENTLYFEITDTGIGIAEQHLTDIFDKFKQLDNSQAKEYKGTGLGLNICKNLIELMGGEIRVESELNRGTSMKFYIPLVDQEKQKKATDLKIESIELNQKHSNEIINFKVPLAVVVDDNKENQFYYCNILNSNGFETLSYNSSRDGLRSIHRFSPDLIVLKFEMPKIHGHTFINDISKDNELCNIPVLIITSAEKLHIDGLNKHSKILYEAKKGNLIEGIISEIKSKRLDIPVNERFILYEKENHLAKFITKKDKCYHNKSLESSKIILARRKIRMLILDGLNLEGVNLQLMKWMKKNKEYLPESLVIVLRDKPFDIVSKEIEATPNCHVLELHRIQNQDSFEEAMQKATSSIAKKPDKKETKK